MDWTWNIHANSYSQNEHPQGSSGFKVSFGPSSGLPLCGEESMSLVRHSFPVACSPRVCVLHTQRLGDFVCCTLWEVELPGRGGGWAFSSRFCAEIGNALCSSSTARQ